MMLSAMPETTWLPRLVMQAKPWTMARKIENAMPAARPSQAEPVTAAVAAAAKAAPSILPSRPMSTTPERSANRPASAASTSGVASRMVESASSRTWRKSCVHQATASAGAGRANRASSVRPEHVLERACEQDHQTLDHHDDVAAQRRHVERQLGAALVERAEQQRGQDDAERMVAAHQRHRDADEAEAAGEVQGQPVLGAHDHVERDQAGERAGDASSRA